MDNEKEQKSSPLKLFLAGAVVNILAVALGTILGWTSPSLRHLEAPNSPIPITPSQNSWISSLMPLAAIFGPLAAGYSVDYWGRKLSLLIIAFPIILSFALLAAAYSVWMLYLGRIIAGFSLGWTFTVMPMYSAEIAEKQYRGALGCLIQFTSSIGLVYVYAVGPYVPYMWLSIACILIPALFIVTFIFMPETPHFYLKRGRDEDAKNSLMWLRSKSAKDVEYEFKQLKMEIQGGDQTNGGIKDILNTPSSRNALFVCLVLLTFQEFTGNNLVLFHAETIFAGAGGSISPGVSTIITGLVCVTAAIPNPYLVEKFGRRLLLIISGFGMAISHGVLGLCFYLSETGSDTSDISLLPVLAVASFLISYSPGFGPLPWTVMGEIYHTNVKATASMISTSFAWFTGFIVTRFYNDLNEAFGESTTFWFYGICCFAGALFVYFFLPETKNKTIAEIQRELSPTVR